MIKAILFDLDDTLLGNNMDDFLPPYFTMCGEFGRRYLPPEKFTRSLILASRAMVEDVNPAVTNNEAFWTRFSELTGLDSHQVETEIDSFYRNEFEQLREVTEQTPVANQVMNWCFAQDLKIVIATNPMFPRRAVEARLYWAGVPVTHYPYSLVTTIENMHATKPHQVYYREILEKIDCRPDQALMAGDDIVNDIEPAQKLGLFTYWIELPGAELPDDLKPTAQGSLANLAQRLNGGWLETLALEKSS
ncbi:MAG: HAD family hydrolase [Candidatus Promineifilaceae bacterium]|jgi:FMN phosphatase YigB (HAD superfamily)